MDANSSSTSLHHEDLLLKLRGKLNEDRLKLWESPYYDSENPCTDSIKDIAKKYATDLSLEYEAVLYGLQELQKHSVDRSRANAEFQETGVATLRVKVTLAGEKPKTINVQKKLSDMGSELINSVASALGIDDNRLKLIFNGKLIKQAVSLSGQGLKNGTQMMAIVMAECPEESRKEDKMYMEMKSTRDDAALLSEYVDDFDEENDYMRLEDQSGKTIVLPKEERKSLLVGLALHERGRAALNAKDYPLALVLLLEADRQFSECNSSLVRATDNWAVLQLDVCWCYVQLGNVAAAQDLPARLEDAKRKLDETYGVNRDRLISLKGTDANERVLFMRLYILQGIAAFYQNKRSEARRLLQLAESEINHLRVDESTVATLISLGWGPGAARGALRAEGGDVQRAHHYLMQRRETREKHRDIRKQRALGVCCDGSPVSPVAVAALVEMGHSRRVVIAALRNSNNHVQQALGLINEHPDMLADTDNSSEDETPSSEGSLVELDDALVAQLISMGYAESQARVALKMSNNQLNTAAEILLAAGGIITEEESGHPSTSESKGPSSSQKRPRQRRDSKKSEREAALKRLTSAIKTEDDDHLDTSLSQEEEMIAQYKALL